MGNSRSYVVGLPVMVTVDDSGKVTYEVDTAETGVSLWEDEDNCASYGDALVEADIARVEADHDRRIAS